jgi:hypothetical protein
MWSCYFADAPVIHAALVPMTRKVCFLTRFEYPGRCAVSSQHRRLRIRIYSDLASHSLCEFGADLLDRGIGARLSLFQAC